jgi:hypothetical protein
VFGPLLLDGKLKSPGRLNAIAPGILVHVVDQLTSRRFLVGAAFSIISHSSSLPASGQSIVGPTGLSAGGKKSEADAVWPAFRVD